MASDIYHDRIEIPIGGTYQGKGWPLYDGDSTTVPPAAYPLVGGETAVCVIKDSYDGNLLTRFGTTEKGWPGLITLTSAAEGTSAVLSMDADQTSLLAPFSNAVFDLQIIDADGEPYRVVYGKAFATPGVSDV